MVKINNKPATTGTVVIFGSDKAEITFPNGPVNIEFDSSKPNTVDISMNPGPTLTFGGAGNAIGQGFGISLGLSNGQSLQCYFTLYTIGDENNPLRTLHYTAF